MASRNRGKRKPKLRDLSRLTPTVDEANALLEALPYAPAISLAIMGAVMVEHELELNLRRRFSRKDDETWLELLSDNGPLGTFHQKIVAGHAFRIYDDTTKDNLHIVRNIRNAFAHSKRLIEFDHELILAELNKAKIRNTRHRKEFLSRHGNPKGMYGTLCLSLTLELGRKQLRAVTISVTRKEKKSATRFATLTPLAAGLAAFLRQPPEGSKESRTSPSPDRQSGDPTTEAPSESPSERSRKDAMSDRKKDK